MPDAQELDFAFTVSDIAPAVDGKFTSPFVHAKKPGHTAKAAGYCAPSCCCN